MFVAPLVFFFFVFLIYYFPPPLAFSLSFSLPAVRCKGLSDVVTQSSEPLTVEGNNNPPKTLIIMRSISHPIQPQRLFERTLKNVIPLLASGGAALGFAQGEEDETEGKLRYLTEEVHQ